MPRKKLKKVTTKTINKLLDAMEDELLSVEAACRKYKDELPASRTFRRHEKKDATFAGQLQAAYELQLDAKRDEMHRMANTKALDLFPECDDWREAEACKRAAIDVLKFELSKLGPTLTKKYSAKQHLEVEHKGDTVQIINYSDHITSNIADTNGDSEQDTKH